MTPTKRLLDLVLASFLILLVAPVLPFLLAALWASEGRPLFYLSERMASPERSFRLVKLRTMSVSDSDSGVSGGDKEARITPVGRWLRRTRVDEIPQLWNVVRGDMSFVGPRPPLREYVERFPDLYRQVLRSRPGITGLATLVYHGHEERLISRCRTAEETDAVYSRACIPRKARLDLIYQRNRSFCMDLVLLASTLGRVIRGTWSRFSR